MARPRTPRVLPDTGSPVSLLLGALALVMVVVGVVLLVVASRKVELR